MAGALVGAVLAAVAGAPAPSAGAEAAPAADRVRGLVYDGLRRSAACGGAFQIDGEPGGPQLCTHGPDPAPPGVDVRQRRTAGADTAGSEPATAAATDPITCVGDGVSGNRVQAIYAVANDRTDRYSSTVANIRAWAAQGEDVFQNTAANLNANRAVRWVTNSGCELVVAKVIMGSGGDDSLSRTITALKNAGYDRTDRKYLVWVDANVYCGIAGIYDDDSAGQSNANNGGYAMYGRVDNGCWGRASSPVEAHELTHNLGGVQRSAPHATSEFHCFDEYDVMCYKDGSGKSMQYICPEASERLLDCRNDDYFHPSPPAGSYLATHWNVANSSFLHASAVAPPPPPPPPPPPGETTTVTYTGTLTADVRSVAYKVKTGSGELEAVSTFSGATWMRVVLKTGSTVIADQKGASPVTATASVSAGTHKVVVKGPAGAKYSVAITYATP